MLQAQLGPLAFEFGYPVGSPQRLKATGMWATMCQAVGFPRAIRHGFLQTLITAQRFTHAVGIVA